MPREKIERRKIPRPTGPYMMVHNGDWKKKFEHESWSILDGSLRIVARIPCQTWPMNNPLKDKQAMEMANVILSAYRKAFP